MIQVINKQRLVFALTVSAFAFLGWQVYGLVVGENAMGQIVWHEQSKKGLTDLSSNENPNINMVSATPAPKILSEIPAKIVQEKPTLMGGERIYMQLLNQYELAKMQRRLLEEEVGIASARSRIADFNQKTQKIVGQVSSDDSAVAAERHSSLVLAYVEKLHGAWSATVNQDGEFEAVHVGSVLADGRTVLAINDVGLTLQNGPAQEMLTFNGLKAQPVVEPSKAAPAAVPALVATPTPALVSANTVADRVVEKPVQTRPEAAVVVRSAAVVAKPAVVVAKPKVVAKTDDKKSALDQMLGDSKNIVVPQAPQLLAKIAQETPMSNDSAMTIDQHILAVRGLLATQSVKDNIVTSRNLVTADKEPEVKAPTAVKVASVTKPAPMAVKLAVASTAFSAAENDLLAASPQDYTIQLLGARDEAQLEALVRAHHLDQQAKIFHTSYLGGDWFVLVYGIFHSRPEAYVAIAGLNQSLHEMHPWVRQLGGIQMALHRMHKA